MAVLLRGVFNRRLRCTRCGASRIVPSRRPLGPIGLTLGLTPSPSQAATRRVGPGKTYSTIRAAAQAAQSGDSILVDAGTYNGDVCTWSASNLVVKGVGGRPILRANGATEGDKVSNPIILHDSASRSVRKLKPVTRLLARALSTVGRRRSLLLAG